MKEGVALIQSPKLTRFSTDVVQGCSQGVELPGYWLLNGVFSWRVGLRRSQIGRIGDLGSISFFWGWVEAHTARPGNAGEWNWKEFHWSRSLFTRPSLALTRPSFYSSFNSRCVLSCFFSMLRLITPHRNKKPKGTKGFVVN